MRPSKLHLRRETLCTLTDTDAFAAQGGAITGKWCWTVTVTSLAASPASSLTVSVVTSISVDITKVE